MRHAEWPWAVNCDRCRRDLKDDGLVASCPGCGARRQRSRVDLTLVNSRGGVRARPFLLALDPFYNQRTIPNQYLMVTVHVADETFVERADVMDGRGGAVSERGVVTDLLKSSGVLGR